MNKKINLICERRLKKYFKTTETALDIARKNIIKGKEKEAKEIIDMAENYLSDARHFEKEGHWVNAFAAINYSHGWIDSASRLGLIKVKDNKLFVLR